MNEIWILMLNDMRTAHFEVLSIVCWAGSKKELQDLVDKETVELYADGEGDAPNSHDKKWHKTFRKNGPLEWCNRPHSGEDSRSYVRTDIPHIGSM